MKRMHHLIVFTAIATIFVLSSCTKKEGCMDQTATNFDPNAEADMGCLYAEGGFAVEFHMHQYIGGAEFIEETQHTINGVATNLNLVQFYVSEIKLVDAAGADTSAPGVYLLISPDVEEYTIGNLPTGDYTKIRFNVGIDSITNHGDPSLYAIGNPLGAQFPSMHWGWSFGYIFMRIDGEVDSDADGMPDPEGQFEMHLGSDRYLAAIEIDYPITIGQGNENIVHLKVDWDTFYTGVDMANDNTTHVTDNEALADILYENTFNMFSPEY